MMYVMKKTRVMIDCVVNYVSLEFLHPFSQISEPTHISHLDPQFQLHAHARNRCVGQVGAVHERDAVHDADDDDQTPVEAVDDFLLLFRGEVGERIIFEGFLVVVAGVAVFEVRDVVVFGVVVYGGGWVWGRHGGWFSLL